MQFQELYPLSEYLVYRFMPHGSNRVYGVPLLVLVLRTSLGRFRCVYLFPVLRVFDLGNWGGRSYRFAFIFISVCVFSTTSYYKAVFLPTIYLQV